MLDKRFESRLLEHKVVKPNGCWELNTTTFPNGYSRVSVEGVYHMAHRISAELYLKNFDAMLNVLHKCDNPTCWNPEHLFQGTQKDNLLDCSNKKRHHNSIKTHCKYGHEYTPENTYIGKRGNRICKSCAIRRSICKLHR